MAGAKYVGPPAAVATDLVNKGDIDRDYANATVSQIAVAGQIATAVASLASQVSVNNALAAFVQPPYYQNQDALLVPLTSVGAPSVTADPTASPPVVGVTGVASLDGTGKIPSVQVPTLGAGYLQGPYGPTATFSASATIAPIKIADWNIGAAGVSFVPEVYMSLLVHAVNLGRPVVEVWISNAPFAYGTGTLLSRGTGPNFWNDLMTVNVVPVPARNAQVGGSGFSPTYTTWITAWLYDQAGQGVSVVASNIAIAGAYLWRYTA
jgi:hypothetical protein